MTEAFGTHRIADRVMAVFNTEATDNEQVRTLIVAAFGDRAGGGMTITDANEGRGVFSDVFRVELAAGSSAVDAPRRVIVKIPAVGANGEAARRSGAYLREALAYTEILPRSSIQAPVAHLIRTDQTGWAAFVLEDLGSNRAVDQLDGLCIEDGIRVASELRRFHDEWRDERLLAELDVRHATPSTLDVHALVRGLDAITDRWAVDLGRAERSAFAAIVENRSKLVEAFAAASTPSLCHGDPRADNLVFDAGGRPILFDWQQLAVQLGEADLAWLAATSFDTEVRRSADDALVAAYGTTIDRYRLGFVLPGLTVLLLAQRQATEGRSLEFIRTSLRRIGAALVDFDTASI